MKRDYRGSHKLSQRKWRGLTRIDVLVIVIIIVVFVTLFLPFLQTGSRPAARRTECLFNLKQIVLATQNFAESHNGQLPQLYAGYPLQQTEDSPTYVNRSWAVALLPELDNAALRRAIDQHSSAVDVIGDPANPRRKLTAPSVPVFQCPLDSNHFERKGGLSYVANAGYMTAAAWDRRGWRHYGGAIDWDGDGQTTAADAKIAHATGVFWRPNRPEDKLPIHFRMTLEYVAAGDGQTNTIMYSENIQAQNWHRADALQDLAFGLRVSVGESGADAIGNVAGILGIARSEHADFGPSHINWNKTARIGSAARPSSNHLGQVMAAFCDGRARALDEKIDPLVYARMLTPDGNRFGQADLDDR